MAIVFLPLQFMLGQVLRDVRRLQLGHFLIGLSGFLRGLTSFIFSPVLSSPEAGFRGVSEAL